MIQAKNVLLRFIAVLDSARIPYAVGGSLASGVHGQPRTTHDFDLLVEMSSEHVKPLIAALGQQREASVARAEAQPGGDVQGVQIEVLRKLLDALQALEQPYRAGMARACVRARLRAAKTGE